MDESTIREWYDIFKDNNELVEIRILDPETRRTYSGYFTDVETIISSIKQFENCNLYFTLNVIDPACYSREQHDKISLRPKSTTSDNEILARKWCLIDIDVEKPSDTNSTDAEKELAKQVVNNIYKFLRDEGFEKPIICDSGNGFHILLKQGMISSKENTEIMKKFLQVLDMYFSTEKVKVDCSTFNPSRICKLYGVYSRKGSNTKERPQRISKILKVPSEIKATPNEYFAKVASYLPEPEKKDRYNNYGRDSFDLDAFIAEHGIKVSKVVESQNYTKYVLEECPFNSSHRAPDAAVFKMHDGSFGFKCLHNSCSQYTFRDFRLHYDPNAYSRSTFKEKYIKYDDRYKKVFEPIVETEEKGEVWMQMGQIKKPKFDLNNYIPSGNKQIDDLIIGFKRKHVTVWSGYRGCAKTTFLNMLILNGANMGYKSALWTGELDLDEEKTWLYLQAAGKGYNKVTQNGFYYTPSNVCDKIDEWIDKYFWIFNNAYKNNFKQIIDKVRELKKNEDIDFIVLDNLMTLDIDDLDGDKNEKQKNMMYALTCLAKELNIHIHIVAHPNKSGSFLRPNNISGTGHIPDLAQNVFILHRIGRDFTANAKEFLSPITVQEIESSGCTNCIEICKCRDKGSAVDNFIHLYFEPESNRLKNDIAEHIVYGWQEEPTQSQIPQSNEFSSGVSDFERENMEDDDPFGDNESSPF